MTDRTSGTCWGDDLSRQRRPTWPVVSRPAWPQNPGTCHTSQEKGEPMTEAGREHIPSGVVRVIEVVGSSPNSFSDAVRTAVKTASETLRHIRGVEVVSSNADVDEDGNLTLYKVACKIAFVYERGSEGGV